jgi:hypothetical protein
MNVQQAIKTLRSKFNLSAIKTKGLTLLIEHAPCCILSFAAGFIGISILNHNPILELGFAIGGAIIGEHIGHKYFVKNHTHKPGWKSKAKRYGASIAFGLASWGVHQAAFHDHNAHGHDTALEQTHQHDCGEHSDQDLPFFGSPALREQMDRAHERAHRHCY